MKRRYVFFPLLISCVALGNNKLENKENIFKKIEIISEKENSMIFEKIKKRYIGKEINEEIIQNLITDLSTELINNGYQTSGIRFVEGNTLEGSIKFEVIYGKINNIFIENEDNIGKIKGAFGEYRGKILNISNIDRGLDNLNVGGNNHLIQIVSSDKEYHSDIVIKRKKERPMGLLTMGISGNQDIKKTNTLDMNIDYSKSNLLDINDNWEINLKRNINIKNSDDNVMNIQFNLSVPYDRLKFNYSYKYDINNSKLKGNTGKIKIENYRKINEIGITNILSRFKKSQLELNSKIILENKKSYIENQKINVQSYDKYIFNLGILHKDELKYGNYSLGANYTKEIKKSIQKTSNEQFKINLKYNKSFNIIKTLPYVVPYMEVGIESDINDITGNISGGIKFQRDKFSSNLIYRRNISKIKEKNGNYFNFNIKFSL